MERKVKCKVWNYKKIYGDRFRETKLINKLSGTWIEVLELRKSIVRAIKHAIILGCNVAMLRQSHEKDRQDFVY